MVFLVPVYQATVETPGEIAMLGVGRMALLLPAALASPAFRQAELPMVNALCPATSDYSQGLVANTALVDHLTPVGSAPLAMLD